MDNPLLMTGLGLVVVGALGLFVRAALRGGGAIRSHGDRRERDFRAQQAAEREAASMAAAAREERS